MYDTEKKTFLPNNDRKTPKAGDDSTTVCFYWTMKVVSKLQHYESPERENPPNMNCHERFSYRFSAEDFMEIIKN